MEAIELPDELKFNWALHTELYNAKIEAAKHYTEIKETAEVFVAASGSNLFKEQCRKWLECYKLWMSAEQHVAELHLALCIEECGFDALETKAAREYHDAVAGEAAQQAVTLLLNQKIDLNRILSGRYQNFISFPYGPYKFDPLHGRSEQQKLDEIVTRR